MSRGPDAGTLLRRAIEANAEAAGCPGVPVESGWTRWASAAFTGARLLLALATTDGCNQILDADDGTETGWSHQEFAAA
ncbi:hypothetical protein, partial [Staphylococcus aureus]